MIGNFFLVLSLWCAIIGGFIFCVVFAKWIIAIISILTGDKDSLHDCNLCDNNYPYRTSEQYEKRYSDWRWNPQRRVWDRIDDRDESNM